MDQKIYNCIDSDLGAQLHELFQKGETEVTVRHPVEGDIIVTKDDFVAHIQNLQTITEKKSPAKQYKLDKQRDRLKKANQIRFRTKMLDTRLTYVDVDDDKSFGFDAEGKKMDIDGMVFMKVDDYLEGIEIYDGELGAMVDEEMKRAPVRIARKL